MRTFEVRSRAIRTTLQRVRDWWEDADWAKYILAMIVMLLAIYGAVWFVFLPLSSSRVPIEHRYEDGVRCYTAGSNIDCVVVR